MTAYNRFSPNYPITASGSIDMLGDEFPSPYLSQPKGNSPLAADFADADTSNWSSKPRPVVTAWEGADMDAYYLADAAAWKWLHCQTAEEWQQVVEATDDACLRLQGKLNDLQGHQCRDIDQRPLVAAVAAALGVASLPSELMGAGE